MSVMFEVYYAAPVNPEREAVLNRLVAEYGGQLDFREEPKPPGPDSVCLTYEFGDWSTAEAAALAMRERGEHVEGPTDYGP